MSQGREREINMETSAQIFKSILELKQGAFIEVTDLALSKVIQNIRDVNTSPTKARKLTITITLKPDDSRQNIAVGFDVKETLAPVNSQVTMLYDNGANVLEMTPSIPGQVDMNGNVQDGPPILRLIS